MLASHPPAPYCGATSRRTVALRPDLDLTPSQVEQARDLRRKDIPTPIIAFVLNVGEPAVDRALLAMRTPKDDRTRASLNVTLGARDFVLSQQQPGEPVHRTMDRLLGELEARREGSF